jgi:hypothetical protein
VQRRFHRLLKSRRAVSAVISNMILIGAVIAVGFAVLGWTYSASNSYVTQYGTSMRSASEELMESLSFEYVFYNNSARNLTVYVMNCGKIGNVSVVAAYVSNTSWSANSYSINIYLLNKTAASVLDIGQEGYFTWPSITLQTGNSYTVKILTWRCSSFEGTFAA